MRGFPARLAALAIVVCMAAPAPAGAWGFAAHRVIADAVIALLPAGLRPWFEPDRAVFVERSIDPDTWRTAGFADLESPNHFLDLDWEGFGPEPFLGLPRDYDAAVAKFGRARILEMGTVPWRVEDFAGRLREAFARAGEGNALARFDVILFSAWLVHYVSDAHVPFHAVVNYDGQLTGQRGIHARFESALFERYRDRLTIDPSPRAPIAAPRDAVFDALIAGTRLAPEVLAADADAAGGRRDYGDAYYAAFFAGTGPVLERRVNESIAVAAAVIAGAWDAAGRPRP